MLYATINDKDTFAVTQKDGQWYINENIADLDIQTQPNGLISVLYNSKSYTAILENVDKKNKLLTIKIDGQIYKIGIQEPIDMLLSNMGIDMKALQKIDNIKAPMPGMILKILVEPGQQIVKGDGLLILEAMKMENIIKATGNATVKSIKAVERTSVEKGSLLIELE